MNLRVHRIKPTEATLQWELSQEFQKSHYGGILGYQVRYYPTRRSDDDGEFIFTSMSAPPLLMNISDPTATSVVLRHLQPKTLYEFAVRAVSIFNGAPEPADAWSMVQGFETLGQRELSIES